MLLYSGPLSLFSRKVEIDTRREGRALRPGAGAFHPDQGLCSKTSRCYRCQSQGQVPVLVDDDLTLYDSTVIIEYLDDKYPDPPLFPREPKARARCRLLELEADEVLLLPVRDLMFRSEPPGPDTARRAEQERAAIKAEDLILVNYAGTCCKTWRPGIFLRRLFRGRHRNFHEYPPRPALGGTAPCRPRKSFRLAFRTGETPKLCNRDSRDGRR